MTGLRPSCGACKFLRRKCSNGCVFAPYFCYDEAPSHFSAVHKVFGASNVSKLLLHLPIHNRGEAAATISYEALARVQDPVYGCISHIYALQQQVFELQEEIETFKVYLANPILISQISQGMTNTDSSFQCPSQSDAMTMHDYFYEQPPDPFPAMNSNPVTTDTNPVVSPQCNLGHQNMCFDPINELDFFGRLSVGMNPLIPCSIEPWLIARDEL